jgi:hypothetical protein
VIGDRLRESRKEMLEIVCLHLAINFSGDAFVVHSLGSFESRSTARSRRELRNKIGRALRHLSLRNRCHREYCSLLSGFGSCSACSQKRNQSRLRS